MALFHQTGTPIVKKSDHLAVRLYPSELTQLYFKMPHKSELRPFSFEGRRYLKEIYDLDAPRILLVFGRQCEKSTSLGNIMLAYSVISRYFKSLYVAPTFLQASQFSNDRLRQPIVYSDELSAFFPPSLTNRVNFKQAVTESEIRLRNAYLNADRIRGIQTDLLEVDELQDILSTLLPVMEECLFHSEYIHPESQVKGLMRWSGTPKTEDNTITQVWTDESTQNEWVIPCDHGSLHATGRRFWNIVGEANIPTNPEDGLVCGQCKKGISAEHPKAHWASMNPNPRAKIPFQGFRVPQLITPMVRWREVLDKVIRYSRQRLFNEVLALPYDSGLRPLTRHDIQKNCDSTVSMSDDKAFPRNIKWARARSGHPTYMGIDWGTGENAYTFITIGGYLGDGKFRTFYHHRCQGRETEPDVQLELIRRLVAQFQVNKIGCDYGGGYDRNKKLIAEFGMQRVALYQYAGGRKKIYWDPELGRFMVRRHEVMADIFSAIKKGTIFCFPRWEEVLEELAPDMLCIFSEYSQSQRCITYDKPKTVPDDGFHSLLYCFFASMIENPRPDVIVNRKEEEDERWGP